jgi:hypothetical protein
LKGITNHEIKTMADCLSWSAGFNDRLFPTNHAHGVLVRLEQPWPPGDFKEGVLKVNIPRNDLKVVVDGIALRLPSALADG